MGNDDDDENHDYIESAYGYRYHTSWDRRIGWSWLKCTMWILSLLILIHVSILLGLNTDSNLRCSILQHKKKTMNALKRWIPYLELDAVPGGKISTRVVRSMAGAQYEPLTPHDHPSRSPLTLNPHAHPFSGTLNKFTLFTASGVRFFVIDMRRPLTVYSVLNVNTTRRMRNEVAPWHDEVTNATSGG